MTIQWTDAAIEAALDAWTDTHDAPHDFEIVMRAALDAAADSVVEIFCHLRRFLQGVGAANTTPFFKRSFTGPVADCLKPLQFCGDEILPPSQFDIAAAIRALKEKQK